VIQDQILQLYRLLVSVHSRLVHLRRPSAASADCESSLGLHALSETLALSLLFLLLLATGKAACLVLTTLLLKAQASKLISENCLAVDDFDGGALVGSRALRGSRSRGDRARGNLCVGLCDASAQTKLSFLSALLLATALATLLLLVGVSGAAR
jgi:hypothetical protein